MLPNFQNQVQNAFIKAKRFRRWKRGAQIFTLAAILVSIPVTVYLANRFVLYLSRAASANVYFQPSNVTLSNTSPNSTISLYVDTGGQVAFSRVEFTFDTSRINLGGEVDVSPSPLKNKILVTSRTQANSSGKVTIVMGGLPGDPLPSGTFEFARIPISLVTSQSTQTQINIVGDIQLVDSSANVVSVNTSPANITLNPGGPTATSTPRPTSPPPTSTPRPTSPPSTPTPTTPPGGTAYVTLEPSPVNLTQSSPNATLTLYADVGARDLVFSWLELSFDPSLVKLSGEVNTSSSPLSTVVQKTSMSEANSSGKIIIVLAAPPGSNPRGKIELAKIPITRNTSQTTTTQMTIGFDQLIDSNNAQYNVVKTNANISISGTGFTPTPTSPVKTPTPTPTGTVGSILRFDPDTVSLTSQNPNATLTLKAVVQNIVFSWVEFNFDTSKVELTAEIDTSASQLATVVQKTSMFEANSTGKVTLVLAASPGTSPSGTIELGKVPFGLKTSQVGQTQVTFGFTQLIDSNNNEIVVTKQPATIHLNTGVSATPTPSGLIPGDADEDGDVDGADYAFWFLFYRQTTTQGHRQGDFDYSGFVDGLDYAIWFLNYTGPGGVTPTATPTRVPTPTPTTGAGRRIYFDPSNITIAQGSTQTSKIKVDVKNDNLVFAWVEFSFDKNRVKLAEEINTSGSPLATVVQKTSMSEANSTGEAILIIAASPGATNTGNIELAELPLTSSSSTGTSQINFGFTQLIDSNNNEITVTKLPATITVN